MIVTSKPPLTELGHFGVKGMHWGQHTISDLAPSPKQIKSAALTTGKAVGKGATTTAKGVGKGLSYAAQHKHMVVGGVIVASILHDVGRLVVISGKTHILFKAAKNREAAYKAGKIAVRALSSSAAKINYAKLVRGAYKITTL